jgi:hypothetical protein
MKFVPYFIINIIWEVVLEKFDTFQQCTAQRKHIWLRRRDIEIWLRYWSLRYWLKQHSLKRYLCLLFWFRWHPNLWYFNNCNSTFFNETNRSTISRPISLRKQNPRTARTPTLQRRSYSNIWVSIYEGWVVQTARQRSISNDTSVRKNLADHAGRNRYPSHALVWTVRGL